MILRILERTAEKTDSGANGALVFMNKIEKGTERVSSGVEGIDKVTEGGFPSGSLILLAGNAGTGKTVLSSKFLFKGAESGETGMYVSFAENKETYTHNITQHLGDQNRVYLDNGKVEYLDLMTVRDQGTALVLETILTEAKRLNVKRLVIDSFSAMAQGFKDPIDGRIVLHSILGKIVRNQGCTTLLISEIPRGEQRIGIGYEEFVVDGEILLTMGEHEGRFIRELEILKMRGTRLGERRLIFTLESGFIAVPESRDRVEKVDSRFSPPSDSPDKFSTGIYELDRLLDGGYSRGSLVLLEIDANIRENQNTLFITPTRTAFLSRGRGSVTIPSSGVTYDTISNRMLSGGFSEEELNRLVKICLFESSYAPDKPFIVKLNGENLKEDSEIFFKTSEKLSKETRQPVLSIVGLNNLLAHYEVEDVVRMWNFAAPIFKERGDLGLIILKPTDYKGLSSVLSSLVDVHLRMTRRHGTLLLHGVKPRIGLQIVQLDPSRGYFIPSLTAIT